jgi:chitin synthase
MVQRQQLTHRLFRGHFVVDNPVPSILLDQCANRDGNEFEKMRYTAITCDPNDFVVCPFPSSPGHAADG